MITEDQAYQDGSVAYFWLVARLVFQLVRRMRLRSSGNAARPYIWRFISLVRVLGPSTRPELQGRVRALRTACSSWRMPVVNERSSGWPGPASTAAVHGRGGFSWRQVGILGNRVTGAARPRGSGQRLRMAASWSCPASPSLAGSRVI